MWKSLLSQLLSPLWSIITSAARFVLARPALMWVIVGIAISALTYGYFHEHNRANGLDDALAVSNVRNDTLLQANRSLVYQRDFATNYADSLTKRNDTLRIQIKHVVGAMAPTERTKLNRSLLSSLRLAQ